MRNFSTASADAVFEGWVKNAKPVLSWSGSFWTAAIAARPVAPTPKEIAPPKAPSTSPDDDWISIPSTDLPEFATVYAPPPVTWSFAVGVDWLMPILPPDVMRNLSALLELSVALVSKVRSVGIWSPATVPFTFASITAVEFCKSVPSAPANAILPKTSASATVVTAPVDVPLVFPNLITGELVAFWLLINAIEDLLALVPSIWR